MSNVTRDCTPAGRSPFLSFLLYPPPSFPFPFPSTAPPSYEKNYPIRPSPSHRPEISPLSFYPSIHPYSLSPFPSPITINHRTPASTYPFTEHPCSAPQERVKSGSPTNPSMLGLGTVLSYRAHHTFPSHPIPFIGPHPTQCASITLIHRPAKQGYLGARR